ncbi:MAG: RIP metalloprotease [Gaiellales bacterium]
MNVAVAIAGLAFLILIHEAGHFAAARAVGMRPRKFYVFFPPVLVKKMHNGIEYGIGAIPLGGYVKIPGMHRPAARDLDSTFGTATGEAPAVGVPVEELKSHLEADDLDEARNTIPKVERSLSQAHLTPGARKSAGRAITDLDDGLSEDAYWRAPAWKRITVIAAGPATNLIFAVALLAIVFAAGVPVDATRTVHEVAPGTPAETIGLRAGDEVVAVDGRPAETFDDVSTAIRGSEGEPITITVARNGERVVLGPARPELTDGFYRLGFVPGLLYERRGVGGAIVRAFDETGDVTVAIGSSLGRIVSGGNREDLATPIGIVQGSSQVLDQGYREFLAILALISLSLALLNMLPLLPLDGGHILFSVLERVRHRAIPREAYEKASAVGIALVLLLFVIGLSNDIGRLTSG